MLIISIVVICLFFNAIFGLQACNPVNKLQNNIEQQKIDDGKLAEICAEKFPNKPIGDPLPGKIDTAALIASLISNLCPETKPVLIPNSDDQENKIVLTSNTSIKKAIDRNALIDSLRKYMKPDTVKTTDSAALKAALFERDNYKKQLDQANKDRDTFKTNYNDQKNVSNKYLAIIIIIAVIAGGWSAIKIYLAFKPSIKL